MTRCSQGQQFRKVKRAILFGMRFEDHSFDFRQQLVGHAVGRAQGLDELLRQVAGAGKPTIDLGIEIVIE